MGIARKPLPASKAICWFPHQKIFLNIYLNQIRSNKSMVGFNSNWNTAVPRGKALLLMTLISAKQTQIFFCQISENCYFSLSHLRSSISLCHGDIFSVAGINVLLCPQNAVQQSLRLQVTQLTQNLGNTNGRAWHQNGISKLLKEKQNFLTWNPVTSKDALHICNWNKGIFRWNLGILVCQQSFPSEK